jgi:hypothetical protein
MAAKGSMVFQCIVLVFIIGAVIALSVKGVPKTTEGFDQSKIGTGLGLGVILIALVCIAYYYRTRLPWA